MNSYFIRDSGSIPGAQAAVSLHRVHTLPREMMSLQLASEPAANSRINRRITYDFGHLSGPTKGGWGKNR